MSETTKPPADGKPAEERERDEALEETFPASDPPAIGGSTGPEDTHRG